ncbi:PAS domain-containing sensor histidine kinase [Phyllobacterium endophyticum]|uniref:PAS domain-containing sensor histidine kinase n=1 Tax=Phyllobacterium endophyticum TaxID=1149773 RepID=UPI0011C932DB|nr:PAS domain-containing sensor histidine kinase [Phyllobacterium endophyticum]TXR47028.1 PAS domain-containing protein [Phyllobacterium endophyticum]
MSEDPAFDDEFRIALDTIPTLVWAARPDGTAEFFNMRWLDYTGLTADEARDWGWVASVHPEDTKVLADTWNTIIGSGEPGEAEARLRRADGVYRWFLFRAVPLRDEAGMIVRWYGTNTDIERRRQAEQRTQRAERQLRAAIDTIPVIVWSALPDGTNDFHNQRLLSYTHCSPDQVRGMEWKAMFHPDDVQRYIETWAKSVATGTPFECESRLRGADGQYRWFLARAEAMRDEFGDIVKWYGTNIDIDDRKLADQKNIEVEKQLRAAIDAIPVMAWTCLPDGTTDFVNQRSLSYTQFCREQMQGMGWKAMIHPDDVQRHSETWAGSVETGSSFECESRLRGADGNYRWFLARAEPMRDEFGNIVKWYGTNIDIEDRKRAEQDLRTAHADLAHAMRVGALGEMTASIVHEVTQPITAIVISGGACLTWLNKDPPELDNVRTSVEQMVDAGNRTGELVQRLRVLAKKGDAQKELLQINEVIQESLFMVERELTNHSVTTRLELTSTLPPLLGDRVQLQQVIVNLIMNGVDAMAAAVNWPRQLLIKSDQDSSDRVIVVVQDSGIGIDPKDLDRLFDAFFTTKPDGLGMGLRICRTIIEDHGGILWASRNAATGATFQFSLPTETQRPI